MPIETLALVAIPHFVLNDRFRAAGTDPSVRVGGDGKNFAVTPLEGGALLRTQIPFGSEPVVVASALRSMLGTTLDSHEDARGILTIPDRAQPKARKYEEVVAEVAELGDWVKKVSAAQAEQVMRDAAAKPATPAATPAMAAMPDLGGMPDMSGMPDMAGMPSMEQLQQLMSAIGPDTLAEMQRAMASGDMAALERVHQQMESAMGADGMKALQESMMGMVGELGGDDPDLARLQEIMATPDSPEAQSILRAVEEEMKSNPGIDDEEYARRLLSKIKPAPGGKSS